MLKYAKVENSSVLTSYKNFTSSELLNLHGLKAAEVNGESKDRDEILADFEAGEYDALCNSMLLLKDGTVLVLIVL